MPSIHQEIAIKASPQRIYEALTVAREFSSVTGKPAQISSDAGGSFSCFDGMIEGRHVELVPNQRIVQAWRVSQWPQGVYSIIKIELEETEDGANLILDQAGFPQDAGDHLPGGWHKMYWTPLREHVE